MLDNSDVEKLIDACRHAVACPSGGFYPDKDYGCLISQFVSMDKNLCHIRQALDGFDGVFVSSASLFGRTLTLNLRINNEEKEVRFII